MQFIPRIRTQIDNILTEILIWKVLNLKDRSKMMPAELPKCNKKVTQVKKSCQERLTIRIQNLLLKFHINCRQQVQAQAKIEAEVKQKHPMKNTLKTNTNRNKIKITLKNRSIKRAVASVDKLAKTFKVLTSHSDKLPTNLLDWNQKSLSMAAKKLIPIWKIELIPVIKMRMLLMRTSMRMI